MRWLQIAVASFLTLAGLMAISALTDHCAGATEFCRADHQADSLRNKPPGMPAAESETPRPARNPPPRAVLAHAFEPLPLSLEQGSTRNFVLPPGQTMLDVATQVGRIAVDELSLIAVVTQDGLRHALVRLPDGRILRLVQGDAIDEDTVAAISDEALFLIGPDLTPRALVLGG